MPDIIVLNEITELLNSVNSGLSSTLSTISTKVGNIETYTKTNNTASTTGTLSQKISSVIENTKSNNTESSTGQLSQKMTYLVNRRFRGVKPGTTNFKTLSTSLTSDETEAGKYTTVMAYSPYTSEFVVAYTGRYRAYCTGTATANDNGGAGVYIGAEVWSNDEKICAFDVTSKSGKGTSSSATKYMDITLEAGNVVKMRIYAASYGYAIQCGGSLSTTNGTAKATDLSIKGTVVELTGNPII